MPNLCAFEKRHFSKNIEAIIGIDQSTVSREVSRNSAGRGYRYKQAQYKATRRRHKAGSSNVKLTPEKIEYIIYLLVTRQWSPEQISGWMKRVYKDESIRHERIYQYIWQDKRNGGSLYKHLRQRGKKHHKRGSKTSGRGLIPNRVGIEHRPIIVDAKQRVGDLEVDTIIGAKRTGSLLSIVDRKTKLTILSLLPNNTSEAVRQALVSTLKPFIGTLHSITSENGKEFAQHRKVA